MKTTLLACLIPLCFTAGAFADVNFTNVLGDSVSQIDRQATFDNLEDFDPLQNYSEDGISITVDDFNWHVGGFGFSGNHFYANGGHPAPYVVTTTDSAQIRGIEFYAGDGWGGNSAVYFAWEAFRDGLLVGSGSYTGDSLTDNTFGIHSDLGLTEIHIGAFVDEATAQDDPFNNGYSNALGLDGLKVQLISSVPEPGATTLLATVAIFVLGRRRRCQYRRGSN